MENGDCAIDFFNEIEIVLVTKLRIKEKIKFYLSRPIALVPEAISIKPHTEGTKFDGLSNFFYRIAQACCIRPWTNLKQGEHDIFHVWIQRCVRTHLCNASL